MKASGSPSVPARRSSNWLRRMPWLPFAPALAMTVASWFAPAASHHSLLRRQPLQAQPAGNGLFGGHHAPAAAPPSPPPIQPAPPQQQQQSLANLIKQFRS